MPGGDGTGPYGTNNRGFYCNFPFRRGYGFGRRGFNGRELNYNPSNIPNNFQNQFSIENYLLNLKLQKKQYEDFLTSINDEINEIEKSIDSKK